MNTEQACIVTFKISAFSRTQNVSFLRIIFGYLTMKFISVQPNTIAIPLRTKLQHVSIDDIAQRKNKLTTAQQQWSRVTSG